MPEEVAVAVLGQGERSRHLEAIASVSGLSALEPGESPEASLADPRVGMVTVLSPPPERAYWIRRSLEKGHGVLCACPPTTRRRGEELLAALAATRRLGVLRIDAPSLHSGFADEVRRSTDRVKGPVYARLRVRVPRAWSGTEGLLGSHSLWGPLLLEELFGRVDTVAAHTRALVRNRPEEDLALAHLEFVNGLEAMLEVHALGTETEADVDFELYGHGGRALVHEDLHKARVIGLQRQYEELLAALQGRKTEPDPLARDLRRALLLTDWVRMAARLGRRLGLGELR